MGTHSISGNSSESSDHTTPTYAPETNPDEKVWLYARLARLANFTSENTTKTRMVLIEQLDRRHGWSDLEMVSLVHANVGSGKDHLV